MKLILILSATLLATVSFGQTNTNDTTIKVIYSNKISKSPAPAFFINGKFVLNPLLSPKHIDSISVVKSEILIDSIKYSGQVYIKMKDAYAPKLISLNALKNKFTDLKDKPVVFMIDDNIVNADYDKYVVDENYILQIVVDNIKNVKEKIDLGLIKIFTKSEENINKAKSIRLRGGEVAIN